MFKGADIKKKRKELSLSAEKLAERLGVSKENIYKWEKGTRPTNPEDFIKLETWLKEGLERVPREKMEDIPKTETDQPEKQKDHRLDDLIKSNLNNSESVLISNRNEERLIRMLESRSDSEKEKNLENLENYAGLIDVIRAIGLKCGYWKNDDTADEELRRFVALHKV